MELMQDKVAIVTGAAAGIGAGVAKLFAEGGAHVFLADLDGAQVKKVAAALQAKGGSAFGFEADARNRDAMAKVVEDAIKRFGRVDVLINNAGIYPRQPFLEMTEEQWDTMQDINLKSVFHCTKLVMPHMVKQRSGAVVNISSVTFFTGLAEPDPLRRVEGRHHWLHACRWRGRWANITSASTASLRAPLKPKENAS